ncbi:dihydroorotase [Natrialbaceae archaeon A-arb3/5]
MAVDTVIAGGKIVTSQRMFDASLAIDDGTIVAVGSRRSLPDGETVVDASGQLVLPGVVDPHVHIASYLSKDSYETATKAAALGGVTTCINFAPQAWVGEMGIWDEPGTVLEAIERQQQKGEESLIDFGLHAIITREKPAVLDEIPVAIEKGVTSFKMFTAYEIGLSNGFINTVLEEIAAHDAVGLFHTEDQSVCDHLESKLRREGKDDPTQYPQSRPDFAEAMAAENAIRMATEAGAKYYGVHTTCAKAADTIARLQEDTNDVRAETCTHYTALDETAYERMGTLPIIAPPLRTAADRDVLFDHLRNGTLEVVSTDHVAFTKADKDVSEWWNSSFGTNSLQTTLPVFHHEAVNERDFSYPFLVRKMCTNPAEIFGLPNKGTLEPGTDADCILFDPTETYTIDASDNASTSDYSVYEGKEVTGRVTKTFLRGTQIAADGQITANSGHGEFIQRSIPEWS